MKLSQKQLQDLKNVELNIFNEFIRVCEQLKLRYFLGYGSALGAVRHQGFIPWDDDIDVYLPRPEYKRFLAEAQTYFSNDYFIQTIETDPEYSNSFAKIRRNDTCFIEESSAKQKINHGIYIDIFPLDAWPETKVGEFYYKIMHYILEEKIRKNRGVTTYGKNIKRGNKQKLFKILGMILFPFMNVQQACQKKNIMAEKLNYEKAKFLTSYLSDAPAKELLPKEVYGEGQFILFENTKVRVPADVQRYLEKIYGDYMTLPSEAMRETNHPCLHFDAFRSYKDYI